MLNNEIRNLRAVCDELLARIEKTENTIYSMYQNPSLNNWSREVLEQAEFALLVLRQDHAATEDFLKKLEKSQGL